MLEELRRYENLGTPSYFWELFSQLKNGASSWTEKGISEHFYARVIDDKMIFDGCLPLLKLSGIVQINEKGVVKIAHGYENILYSETLCKSRLLEGFLSAFSKDDDFSNIFARGKISYDYVYRCINVDLSVFSLRYSNVRNLLLDFEFFKRHPDFPSRTLIISSRWKKIFEKIFGPQIREKKIGIEALRQQQEQLQIRGEIAEEFVLNFEHRRLGNKDGIQWIAPYDAGAGYDILSFHGNHSVENDRRIEVKGYIGPAQYFFWTRNEVKVAKEYGEDYCLYLVDRNQIDNPDYEPVIIADPAKNVLHNDAWVKVIDKYYLKKEDN